MDQCVQRFALLNRADDLLNEVRLFRTGVPVREAIAQHQALLREARLHLESAQSLVAANA